MFILFSIVLLFKGDIKNNDLEENIDQDDVEEKVGKKRLATQDGPVRSKLYIVVYISITF